MIYLIVFLFGLLVDRYFLPILDLLLRNLENWQSFKATEMQYEIDKLVDDSKINAYDTKYVLSLYEKDIQKLGLDNEHQMDAIGFAMGSVCEEEDCEDLDEIEEDIDKK